MSKTDTDAFPAAPDAPVRRRPAPADDERALGDEVISSVPAVSAPPEEAGLHGEPVVDADPVFMSETVRRMERRHTRILAVLSLLVAVGATAVIVGASVAPEPATPIDQATGSAWSSVAALSDGLRDLGPDAALEPLRGKARAAREEVQAAGARMKTLALPVSQTPLRTRVVRTLRADDAWIDAVGSTLATPRSRRRGDLAVLAKRAAVATSLIAGDVEGARDSVGGTGRLLSATRRGG